MQTPPTLGDAVHAKKITDLKPTVLLISIDGFRWDYAEKTQTPNLHKLIATGVSAELIPSFPTKTFPNHYSIVTGLYPGNHGIVANNMWDPDFKAGFKTTDRKEVGDTRWWGGEPIWVTAGKQGQKTAPLFWPGSEAEIQGMRPDHWEAHDSKVSHEARLAKVLSWIDLPESERPRFLTLYFQDVDDAGHDFGPESEELKSALRKVDATLGRLLQKLDERGIADKLNIIVVSDHGMAAVSPQRLIFLEQYFEMEQLQVVDWSPVLAVRSKSGNDEAVYGKLKTVPHLTVYRKTELPERFHYRKSPRIAPVIAIADEGWEITTHRAYESRKKEWRGTHGYDNQLRTMHGIFIARGQAFKKGVKLKPFENVNIYEAMAKVLGLQPAPNDGRLGVLAPAMKMPTQKKLTKTSGHHVLFHSSPEHLCGLAFETLSPGVAVRIDPRVN